MNGVAYCVGGSFSVRLVVSLWTLRRFWTGPVALFSLSSTSEQRANLLAADARVNVQHAGRLALPAGRNATLAAKTMLTVYSPFERTLFLDADTIVTGPLDELIHDSAPLVATRHRDWPTRHPQLTSHFGEWRNLADDVKSKIDRSLALDGPAINTGVFGFRRDYLPAGLWRDLAHRGADLPATDEVALQLLLPDLSEAKIVGEEWNYTIHPDRDSAEIARPDVRVVHFNQGSHAGAAGQAFWLPPLLEAWRANVGGVRDWGEYARIDLPNRFRARLRDAGFPVADAPETEKR